MATTNSYQSLAHQRPTWTISAIYIQVAVIFCLIGIQSVVSVSGDVLLNKTTALEDVKVPALPTVLSKAVSEIEQQACDVSLNCTRPHQICMNGRCGCMPNFVWRNGECHREDCLGNEQMCRQQDPNRNCEALPWFGYSHCVCRDGFIEDPLTLICRPKCVSDLRHFCDQVDSVNSLCNVYRCQCKANFRRNTVTGQCEPFRCDYDAQCWSEGDKYRTCLNGTCGCNYEEDPITKRCMLKFTSLFKIKNYYNWHTERILLATIFFVPIVFYYCVLQNFRRAKSTVVAFRAPRPGEQFYSAQSAISIQSPKFIMQTGDGSGGDVEVINTDVKKVPIQTKTDPKGESANIKYQRFS